jgi:hypothetical protein
MLLSLSLWPSEANGDGWSYWFILILHLLWMAVGYGRSTLRHHAIYHFLFLIEHPFISVLSANYAICGEFSFQRIFECVCPIFLIFASMTASEAHLVLQKSNVYDKTFGGMIGRHDCLIVYLILQATVIIF